MIIHKKKSNLLSPPLRSCLLAVQMLDDYLYVIFFFKSKGHTLYFRHTFYFFLLLLSPTKKLYFNYFCDAVSIIKYSKVGSCYQFLGSALLLDDCCYAAAAGWIIGHLLSSRSSREREAAVAILYANRITNQKLCFIYNYF